MNSRNWGGKRPGAGRPRGSTKEISVQRKPHQVRAYDDEWAIIKAFASIVKKDPERAIRMMKTE
ncbi:hypothetical protein [uncultured Megasphaera sp.]|uniref:hypothetical protein n=1 Tax=uncultured Megasphaera sp. TaxID=165188 RepID=UPI0025912DE2|nr:hypothetical protein [uncultured Megasphaera sp.]